MEDRCKGGKMLIKTLVVCGFLVCYVSGKSIDLQITETKDCTKEIGSIKGALGGWKKLSESEVLSEIVPLASYFINTDNAQSNRLVNYKLSKYEDNGPIILKAYKQLVNGLNYCFVFEAEADGCKNGNKGGICKGGHVACAVQMYQPFAFLLQGAPQEGEFTSRMCKELKSSPK